MFLSKIDRQEFFGERKNFHDKVCYVSISCLHNFRFTVVGASVAGINHGPAHTIP